MKEKDAKKKLEESIADEDVTTSEEAKAKALMFLAETKRPDLLTDINEKEIKIITTMESLADHFDVDIYKKVTKHFKNHRVSLQRKGRGEIIQTSKAPTDEGRLARLKEMLPFVSTGRG